MNGNRMIGMGLIAALGAASAFARLQELERQPRMTDAEYADAVNRNAVVDETHMVDARREARRDALIAAEKARAEGYAKRVRRREQTEKGTRLLDKVRRARSRL